MEELPVEKVRLKKVFSAQVRVLIDEIPFHKVYF